VECDVLRLHEFDAACRVLSDELGHSADSVPLHPTAEAVTTGRDQSKSEETETFYSHGICTAAVPESTKITL
jgi:hypothetical protein